MPANTTVSLDRQKTAVADLTAMLPGQVALPGDPYWEDETRLGWTRSVDQRPIAVVTIREEEDVAAAVRWAAHNGLSVSAQPFGHGATTALNGAVILRTQALQGISIDAAARTARVGAGVGWGDLLNALGEHGLAALAGSSTGPSVVGYTLGGGLSWFGRSHGLAAHNVMSFDIVDATGDRRVVTAGCDPDLFWALRGGGGDFAIVLSMEIALFPAAQLYGGRMLWPVEMAFPVLHAFRDITENAPDELTVWAHFLQFPPIAEIPEPLRGGAFISVDVAYLGAAADGAALLAPLDAIPAKLLHTLGMMSIADLGTILAEPTEPTATTEMSGLLSSLDDEAIESLITLAGKGSRSPLVGVQLRHLGGAFTRATEADGPSGALTEPYSLFAIGVPFSPEGFVDAEISFARLTAALNDNLSGRTFFNMLSADDNPGRAFSPAALQRLQTIKQTVDPNGVLVSNRPVLRAH
jgi:FAD binding domain